MHWIGILLAALLVAWILLPRLFWLPADQAAQKLRNGALLIDVRTRGEFSSHAVPGALNLPLHELQQGIQSNGIDPDREILLNCASGMRSATAARQLKAIGYRNIWNVGGLGRALKITRPDS